MPRYDFGGPRLIALAKVPCCKCGKKTKRQNTIEKTVNPFNRNADGVPKTWQEVYADVREACNEWTKKLDLSIIGTTEKVINVN